MLAQNFTTYAQNSVNLANRQKTVGLVENRPFYFLVGQNVEFQTCCKPLCIRESAVQLYSQTQITDDPMYHVIWIVETHEVTYTLI